MRSLLIATHNLGKLREIQEIFFDLPLNLVTLPDFPGLARIEERGTTFSENASLKARGYASKTGVWTVADDSGLEVDALGGRPGVFSARYASEDKQRIARLLAELSGVEEARRTARFVCAVGIADDRAKVIEVTVGKCEGRIALEPRGRSGFGFDPVFIPEGFDVTFAEMSPETKNRISHRARALEAARRALLRSL